MSNHSDKTIDSILWDIEDDYLPGEKDFVDKRIAEAKAQLLALLLERLPEKQVKKWDDEDGFCTTCEAFLEDDKYRCYCDIRNETADECAQAIKEALK